MTTSSFISHGDFPALLRQHGHRDLPEHFGNKVTADLPQATTVLAFHYTDGVLIAGDRRATAGNVIMYDRADKVITLDATTVLAIAGSPATAFEMARTLQHSFQYYRRSQLQPLSGEAKVRALGQLIKNNLGLSLQGVGAVVPILALRDETEPKTQIYFYDILGAQFQAVDFAASGSGSPTVRSVLQFTNRWGSQPTVQMNEEQAIRLALQLLDTAAESDSATGGMDRRTQVYPQVMLLTAAGLTTITPERLQNLFFAD